MRLTKKSDYHFEHYTSKTTLNCLLAKLGQLEDIEDELGIDLITLFKALKNGIYANGYERFIPNLVYFPRGFFAFTHNLNNRSVLYFKEYGKTWALTKEELL